MAQQGLLLIKIYVAEFYTVTLNVLTLILIVTELKNLPQDILYMTGVVFI